MKNRIAVSLWLVFFTTSLYSQLTRNNYIPLKCAGEIPSTFLETAEEKYKKRARTISTEEDKRTQKNKDEFYESSSYMLDRILLSGDVIFGDTLTAYIDKIADDLLKDDPELRSKIQLFTFKSPYVNAFATDQGFIFVNIGLIAQVANEAELAYVIAHEIIHFRENHSIKQTIENDLIRRGKGDYKQENQHDKVNSYYQYSKGLETEADKEGLKLLANSSYNALKAKGLFDVLLYSYLPFDEEEFDASFLANSAYEFPEKLLMDSTRQIKARSDVDDKHSSHPNVKNRRKATYKYFKRLKGKGGDKKTYLSSKSEFKYVRDLSRFEVIRQNIIDHRYDRAIYNIYLMKKKYPDNQYLNKCLITSLEGALLYKEEGVSNQIMSRYKKVEGSSQATSYWLKKIKKRDLAVVLAGKTYETYKIEPNNTQLKKSLNRSLSRLVNKYNMYEEDFFIKDSLLEADMDFEPIQKGKNETASGDNTKKKEETINDIFDDESEDEFAYVEDDKGGVKSKKEDDDEMDDFYEEKHQSKSKKKKTSEKEEVDKSDGEKSKYDKIKEREKSEEAEKTKKLEFHKMIFYNFFTEPRFIKAFENASENKVAELTQEEERAKEKREAKEEKLIARKGQALGIDKITILDPTYCVIDDRSDDAKVMHVKSELQKAKLDAHIADAARRSKLVVDVLNPKNIDQIDIESFNANVKLKEWFLEATNHEVDSVPTIVSSELDGISKALGTRYVATQEVYNIRLDKNEAKYILSMAYLVTIPWAIVKLTTQESATYFRFRMVDIEEQKIVFNSEYFYQGKDNEGALKGCLYNSFIQVKRDKK